MSSTTNPSAECAWCGEDLQSDSDFHAVGASVSDRQSLESNRDGHMVGIEFPDRGRTVFALLPPTGSPARQEDHDLWFHLCSEACAKKLRGALDSDSDLVNDTELT